MSLTAIPCILYVEHNQIDKLLDELDEGGTNLVSKTGRAALLPDFSREVYEVGPDHAPAGPVAYKAEITLTYTGQSKPEKHEMEIMAKNSFEAAGRAFNRFGRERLIDSLDDPSVDVQITRIKK